jgi:ribonuclease HI
MYIVLYDRASAACSMSESVKIFFDGGYRPVLGEMETAVVARGALHHQPRLGPGSSEEAEWLALLHALRVARMLGVPNIILVGDSASVINQAKGVTTCRAAACLENYRDQLRHFAHVRLRQVPRTQNLAGIALARLRNGAGHPI